MTDAAGAVVATYEYDTFGNHIGSTGSVNNPYRYAGYRWDAETGLYYLNARYYAPGIGRFITRDAFHGFEDNPASLNWYNYAHSNPVMFVDPSGYFVWAVAGATLVGYTAYKLGQSMGLTGWRLALFAAVGAGIGGLVGNALTPVLKPLVHVFINWGKAVGVVSTTAGYKIMVHWPHHGKGIHIVLQRLTHAGNWRTIFEKIFWR
ncbi:MAG: RHS repeat-associated core domain-containing protein [Dethiobacter sp.]|nr:RHS repeat-associated core domain-containing protein [Dethiobacter sp.]MBS3902248.1 RHS repeat-associated core domain-containing protein [Dethiobacter sp.]MBS3989207.1 RHS repeat-associated core domain-containing protein [Dethiobacter sp.]